MGAICRRLRKRCAAFSQKTAKFFERGLPVRVIRHADGTLPSAEKLTNHYVVIEAHRLSEPVKFDAKGNRIPVTLPDRVAQMYLDMVGEWQLQPLAGITTSPLLSDDGGVRIADGYDPDSMLWCCGVPQLRVPLKPSREDAERAVLLLRQAFRTFPFADSPRIRDIDLGVDVVDLAQQPGIDESAFLVALLTAVCRSSLWLAPALALTAAAVSGAGSGKGLLVRAICAIAFGTRPRAFTSGSERQELDKRLAAELVEAQPALFLDNVNGVALRSDTLASVLTERPARVRLLGVTRMVPLNSSAFIAITGNGLTLTEDLARRFITCELNAGCEDPESRPFRPGFLQEIEQKRCELLLAALTIWRWGRQNATQLPRGKPLGSFEKWAEWCRDPLVALGCRDPVERVESIKAQDPRRQRIVELFEAWWKHHGSAPVKVSQLDEAVRSIADPQERGRQYLATFIASLAGTHAAGFVLSRQEAAGKWAAATYALKETAAAHGTDRADQNSTGPNRPMGPMPDDVDADLPPGAEAEI
jgi:putative DNA primase/helicase